MSSAAGKPRALVVLVVGDREVPLRRVGPATRCDLGLVDDLLRLRLAAMRSGWSIKLTHVHPNLRELFDLVGLGDCFEPLADEPP